MKTQTNENQICENCGKEIQRENQWSLCDACLVIQYASREYKFTNKNQTFQFEGKEYEVIDGKAKELLPQNQMENKNGLEK